MEENDLNNFQVNDWNIFRNAFSPFDLQMIQLPLCSLAVTSQVIQAPLDHIQHFARNLWPRVHWTLDVVLFQLMFVPIIWVDHHFPLCILLEYHIGSEHAAQLAQEAEGVIEEVFRGDVDNQDQLAHG